MAGKASERFVWAVDSLEGRPAHRPREAAPGRPGGGRMLRRGGRGRARAPGPGVVWRGTALGGGNMARNPVPRALGADTLGPQPSLGPKTGAPAGPHA